MNTDQRRGASSGVRVAIMAVAGIATAFVIGLLGYWPYAPTAGWAVAAAVYVLWVWLTIARMSPEQTSSHATREDPTRGTSDILVVLASVASLVAVLVLLLQLKNVHGATRDILPIIALLSVGLSWFLVHTLFTLRYAENYYHDDLGGIDFNEKQKPRYVDFAYFAFTIGMTFQVSDTNITRFPIRATALRHALLSYLFGAVILATTVNLVASLAS
jgi:uncharacterized membrane protein